MAGFIEQTILSVINQNYPNLEYIIIDGGSTDGTVDIIKKYENSLSYWISEPDKGMYYAVQKGFDKSTGDIMGWINADDKLWAGSLRYVAEVFSSRTNVHWIQGFPSVIDEKGDVIFQRAHVFSKDFFYLGKHEKTFSFIQQESTFWSRNLWARAGGKLNLQYKLAADFDLWLRFFELEEHYCTNRQLAAFRKRANQKSTDTTSYLKEATDSVNRNRQLLPFSDKVRLAIVRFCMKKHRFTKRIETLINSLLIAQPSYIDKDIKNESESTRLSK
jgi:glycosyltransferase involved in cell wall biosynthesis